MNRRGRIMVAAAVAAFSTLGAAFCWRQLTGEPAISVDITRSIGCGHLVTFSQGFLILLAWKSSRQVGDVARHAVVISQLSLSIAGRGYPIVGW